MWCDEILLLILYFFLLFCYSYKIKKDEEIKKLKEENSNLRKQIDEKNKLENDLINSRKSFLFYFVSFWLCFCCD
jgi:uncharacterized ion transporter superfamily protein YfcC